MFTRIDWLFLWVSVESTNEQNLFERLESKNKSGRNAAAKQEYNTRQLYQSVKAECS